MQKSSAFFFISNYNTDPYELVRYSNGYRIVDQSDEPLIVHSLQLHKDDNLSFKANSGTSLINYLDFIIEEFSELPPLIAFLKGNVIGRHINRLEFERRITNTWYTYLWDEKLPRERRGLNYKPQNNSFLEVNNSWFVPMSHHRFFTNFDHFMMFFFRNYERSRLIDFCPGACFIVERERITQHPRGLYVGLRYILNYEFFPSEAWMVERAFNMIFSGDLTVNDWVRDDLDVVDALSGLPDLSKSYVAPAGHLRPVKQFLKGLF